MSRLEQTYFYLANPSAGLGALVGDSDHDRPRRPVGPGTLVVFSIFLVVVGQGLARYEVCAIPVGCWNPYGAFGWFLTLLGAGGIVLAILLAWQTRRRGERG